jgi:sugar lactone lactonase YvrE
MRGNKLYTADIDTLRTFDRSSGAPLESIHFDDPFTGPLFLNDVVVTDSGIVYVTDPGNSAIFTVDGGGTVSLVASGPALLNPNDIQADGERISWVTLFGNQVLSLNKDGSIQVRATLPSVDVSQFGVPPGALLLDGYVLLRDGMRLVSSWVTGEIYQISAFGNRIRTLAKVVSLFDDANNPNGPADINLDRRRDRLLIPLFNANQLLILTLDGELDN